MFWTAVRGLVSIRVKNIIFAMCWTVVKGIVRVKVLNNFVFAVFWTVVRGLVSIRVKCWGYFRHVGQILDPEIAFGAN